MWAARVAGPFSRPADRGCGAAISIHEDSVVCFGHRPRATVVCSCVARQISEQSATIVRRELIAADEDDDGAVTFELGGKVPYQSIWVAIELATGASAVATPEEYPLRQVSLPVGSTMHAEGISDWIQDARGLIEALLVRPREGAWGATVGDGGAADDDGTYDGSLALSLEKMRGLGEQAPAAPDRFAVATWSS